MVKTQGMDEKNKGTILFAAEELKKDVIDFVLEDEEEFKTDFDSIVFCERITFTLSRIVGAEGNWM